MKTHIMKPLSVLFLACGALLALSASVQASNLDNCKRQCTNYNQGKKPSEWGMAVCQGENLAQYCERTCKMILGESDGECSGGGDDVSGDQE